MAPALSSPPISPPASRTAVVLVNWKGWRDTIECLASLMLLSETPGHIVVVDNASPDGSADHIERWCRGDIEAELQSPLDEVPLAALRAPAGLRWASIADDAPLPAEAPCVTLVRSSTNRGFAGGNNLGVELALAAGMDFAWLLNTDTVVASDALAKLLERAQERPDAGIVGSSLIYYWRPAVMQAFGGAHFDRRNGTSVDVGSGEPRARIPSAPEQVESVMDYVVGASMLVTRHFYETVGPMCEDYFLYFEEMDWAVRAHGRFAMAYAPGSRVFHKVGGSSVKQASRFSLRFLYRNRVRFMARYFPESLPGVRRRLLLQLFQHLRRGHWDDALEIAGALKVGQRHPIGR